MTTKVTITCQENSHWDLVIYKQNKPYDFDKGVFLDWETNPAGPIVLGPGESTEHLYVHDTCRYIVEEKVREQN